MLARLVANPAHHVYAAAFHHVELDQAVPPLFGFQCEENLQRSCGAAEPVERWDCGTWSNVPAVEDFLSLRPAPLKLLQEQLRPAKWQVTVRQLEKLLISVCKRLSAELRRRCLALNADFAVLLLDDFRLTPRCVSRSQLLRLFPHLDAPQQRAAELARMPLEQQVDQHLAALDSGDESLTSDAAHALQMIGSFAAPAVARSMATQTDVWRHAMLLDHFRVRDPQVIAALKAAALRDSPRYSNWPASALATLGEVDFLINTPALSDACLVSAVLHPFTWSNRRLGPQPLSYAAVDRLMHARPSTIDLLLRGFESSSFNPIKATDLATALAGAAHPFAGIRRHAAYVLDRKALGTKNGPRIVAALLPLLTDANARVRLNALLTLQTWTSAFPADHRPLFEKLLQNETDPFMRDIAVEILAALTSRGLD